MKTSDELRMLMLPAELWKDMEKAALDGKPCVTVTDGSYNRKFEEMLDWVHLLESRDFIVQINDRTISIYWSWSFRK